MTDNVVRFRTKQDREIEELADKIFAPITDEMRDNWDDYEAPMIEDAPQLREPITVRVVIPDPPSQSSNAAAVVIQIIAGAILGFVAVTYLIGV